MEAIKPQTHCTSMSSCRNMKFCIERALKLHNDGDFASAKMSFLSDIGKSDCTQSIKMPKVVILQLLGSVENDFEKFKEFLEGFNIACKCNT